MSSLTMSSTTAGTLTATGNEVYRQTNDSGTMAYIGSIPMVSFAERQLNNDERYENQSTGATEV